MASEDAAKRDLYNDLYSDIYKDLVGIRPRDWECWADAPLSALRAECDNILDQLAALRAAER
jgi:hypothetical protein